MSPKNLQAVFNRLDSINWLQECIIIDVRWLQYGYIFEIDFNNIWANHNKIRANLEQIDLVTVRMKGVQKITFIHAFNKSNLENPQKMNWGKNEISRMKVEESNKTNDAFSEQTNYYVVQFRWETKRVIEVLCLEFDIKHSTFPLT